jgi:DNA-binding CsgD family transcriptional regulator
MEGLGLRELRTFSAFLEEMYALRGLEEFTTYVLSRLPEVVPADRISYNEANPRARRNAYTSLPTLPAEYEPVFLRHMEDHPLISHYQKTHDGRALRVSDFLPRRRFHRLALYNEFFRPLRAEYQMAVTLPAPAPLSVGIALSRSRTDFSDRERRLLNLLRPHLIQAYRNAESVTHMRGQQAVTGEALDALPYGLIVLTRDGHARPVNAAAVRMVAAYFGSPLRGEDRLPEDLERWVGHQVAADAGTNAPGRPRTPLVIGRGGHDLIVRLIGAANERRLLLEERTSAPAPHSLMPLGLTRREADVMVWLIQGRTNAEIAATLGTSPYTVIKHLQHIFAKLGVRTRTAAAARVLKILTSPPA